MTEDPTAAARRWLAAGHRTWRWNDGSYAGKNQYQALETSDAGLSYFAFDGTREGLGEPVLQAFQAFRADGPLRPLPPEVLAELQRWLDEHGR